MIKRARIYWNVLLVRMGMRRILPADYINGIRIVECDEPMVRLPDDERLFKTDGQTFVGRKGMVERLVRAAQDVAQKGYRLHIYQTYRSPDEQAERRSETYRKLKERYPDYAEEDILRMLNKATAGIGGGHQTGGAVDLGLCNSDGVAMDMGTQYREHNPKTATHSRELSDDCRRNRMTLTDAMQRAGFVNYTAEWWHFSYGDRMWAAYRNKQFAIYGTR